MILLTEKYLDITHACLFSTKFEDNSLVRPRTRSITDIARSAAIRMM